MRHRTSCLRSSYSVFTFRCDVFGFRFVVFGFLVLPGTPRGCWVWGVVNTLYLPLPISTLSNMWINTDVLVWPVLALITERFTNGRKLQILPTSAALKASEKPIGKGLDDVPRKLQADCKKAARRCKKAAIRLQEIASRVQERCKQTCKGVQKCWPSMLKIAKKTTRLPLRVAALVPRRVER
jgi:hypothetical protein